MSAYVSILYMAVCFVLIAAIGIILWQSITMRRIPVFICLFLILPIGQAFMLYSFAFEGWSLFWAFGLFLSLAAHILLLIYTILQEKKTAAEEELREMRHRIALEKSHYDAVKQRRMELDELRLDFSKKLEAVAAFVESGEAEEANESISRLAKEIADTRERPYCAIPVINAVLTEKQNDCTAAGITLSVDLILPDTLAIEPMHLCSIFSNLLDNAIAACKEMNSETKPMVRLYSRVDGDYLFIKSINPSRQPPKKPISGRGYGSHILSGLAARYGGSYQGGYKSGEFVAIISLLAKG